jgi:hypothetical protein
MTFGELFREIVIEVDGPEAGNEANFKYADTVAPSVINQEIPPEMLEQFRIVLTAQCREYSEKFKTMSREELQAELNKHLSKN